MNITQTQGIIALLLAALALGMYFFRAGSFATRVESAVAALGQRMEAALTELKEDIRQARHDQRNTAQATALHTESIARLSARQDGCADKLTDHADRIKALEASRATPTKRVAR